MADSNEEKEKDVLDRLRDVDKTVKARLLFQVVEDMRYSSRQLLEIKEKNLARLAAIGISEKDIKRIIDYINELPEVRLTESDIEDIKDSIQKETEQKKKRERDQLLNPNKGVTTGYPQYSTIQVTPTPNSMGGQCFYPYTTTATSGTQNAFYSAGTAFLGYGSNQLSIGL